MIAKLALIALAAVSANAAAPDAPTGPVSCDTCQAGVGLLGNLLSGPSLIIATSELKQQCQKIKSPNSGMIFNCEITVDQMIPDVANYIVTSLLPEICVAAGDCPSSTNKGGFACTACSGGVQVLQDFLNTPFASYAINYELGTGVCDKIWGPDAKASDPVNDNNCKAAVSGELSAILAFADTKLLPMICEKTCDVFDARLAAGNATDEVCTGLNAMLSAVPRVLDSAHTELCPTMLKKEHAAMCTKIVTTSAYRAAIEQGVVARVAKFLENKYVKPIINNCSLAISDPQVAASGAMSAARHSFDSAPPSPFECDLCYGAMELFNGAVGNPLVRAGIKEGFTELCGLLASYGLGSAFQASCMYTATSFSDDLIALIQGELPLICKSARCNVPAGENVIITPPFRNALCAAVNSTAHYPFAEMTNCSSNAASSPSGDESLCATCRASFEILTATVSSPGLMHLLEKLMVQQCNTLSKPLVDGCISGVHQFTPKFLGYIGEYLLGQACCQLPVCKNLPSGGTGYHCPKL